MLGLTGQSLHLLYAILRDLARRRGKMAVVAGPGGFKHTMSRRNELRLRGPMSWSWLDYGPEIRPKWSMLLFLGPTSELGLKQQG